jgi:hypothetical protein
MKDAAIVKEEDNRSIKNGKKQRTESKNRGQFEIKFHAMGIPACGVHVRRNAIRGYKMNAGLLHNGEAFLDTSGHGCY